jgi:hypothetical protein
MIWSRTLSPCCLVIALGLLRGVASAGEDEAGRREAIVKNMLTAMGKITKTLTTIEDQGSAAAAKGDIKKAADEWRILLKKAENIAPPSKAEADRLAKAYKAKLEEAQKVLFTQILRVQQIPGGRDTVDDLAKVFAPAKKSDR